MLTKLGKLLRVIRIEEGENMRDMASKLDVSLSYLSAIENGKRNVPDNLENVIVNSYDLDNARKDELKTAIQESKAKIKVDVDSLDNKKKELLFALTNNTIDDDTVELMCQLMKEKGREK